MFTSATESGIVDSAPAVSERLAALRAARGQSLDSLAREIGVRRENLEAIEEGRFSDLPTGIYGRAALKSFAAACGLDPLELLASCEPFLRPAEEPIEGLARLRGLARPKRPARAESPTRTVDPIECPAWRPLAAAAVDALVIAGFLLVVVFGAALSLVVPISALDRSAGWFALVGIVLGLGYFAWFAGLVGTTLGDRAVGTSPGSSEVPTVTLRDVRIRTLRSATEDVRSIQRLGIAFGALTTFRSAAQSTAPLSTRPSPGVR
jgi:transcriptional regulator with XRE-family HTH domain